MQKERPMLITVLCFISFISTYISVPFFIAFYRPIINTLGELYGTYVLISSIVTLVWFIGIWQMKKWGAILIFGFSILNQILLISMKQWNPLALVPLIMIVILMIYYKDMD
jgi:hypothetical protein